MQIVIDISEERYTEIQNMDWKNPIWASEDIRAIHNGIPRETVTDFADRCRECGREKVLDKIRDEIEQITDTMGVSYNQYISKIDVLQIIDKYRKEQE